MPAPTDPAPDVWASDATFSATGKDWDGEDTKVAPSSGRVAEGFEPEENPPAEHFNWWMNRIGQWVKWLSGLAGYIDQDNAEFTYPVVTLRTVHILPTAGVSPDGSWGIYSSDRGVAESGDDAEYLLFDLAQYLPSGAEITDLDVMVKPGAVRTGIQRMIVSLVRSTPDWGTPGLPTDAALASAGDDGTIDDQVIALSVPGTANPEAHSVRALRLAVKSGDDGGAHAADRVYAIRVVFRDPGPRNY